MLKISFCTVSMNRLEHLEKTFIRNITDNLDYPNIEFNLLNYNSDDEIDEWVKVNLTKYIDMGIVKYYKTTDPVYFDRSHSRNMIFKLSEGDVICNLDADNFCGPGFAEYINHKFTQNDNLNEIFLMRKRELLEEADRNSYGRIVVKKEHFHELKGFDERMSGYGFEDTDFINRLEKKGCNALFIDDPRYLQGVSHSQAMRIAEEKYSKTISNIYVAQISPALSKVLFLFNNDQFHFSTLVDYELIESLRFQTKEVVKKGSKYPIEFLDNRMHSGIWNKSENNIYLSFDQEMSNLILAYDKESELYRDIENNDNYFMVESEFLKENLIYLFPQIQNRNYMELNLTDDTNMNKDGYGKGRVSRNFSCKQFKVI